MKCSTVVTALPAWVQPGSPPMHVRDAVKSKVVSMLQHGDIKGSLVVVY